MTVETLKPYGLEELSESELRDFLFSQRVGVLGLPTGDHPYLLPMAFTYDGESSLYFTYFVGDSSRKVTLTENAETASFLVYAYTAVFSWESAILTGRINQIPEDEWHSHPDAVGGAWHLAIFDHAETAGEKLLYEFDITDQTGIKATGLPPGMEEYQGYD